MEIATLVRVLDQPHQAAESLAAWGLGDVHRGQRLLVELAELGLTLDLLASLCRQLGEHLPRAGDPDDALAGLVRFLSAVRSPLALAALFTRDGAALPMLLAALSLGPRWTEMLADDPEAFDLLRQTGGQPANRQELIAEVKTEAAAFRDERAILAALGRIKQRHQLRIAYGEVVLRHRFELVSEQLSALAEAIVEAALQSAVQKVLEARPVAAKRGAGECVVLALGRLGGGELGYDDSLELLYVYDSAGDDAADLRASAEHHERVARGLARLLGEAEAGGSVYRAELLPLPDSPSPVLAHSAVDVAIGMESFGRTWHRQALLQARPIAGRRELGNALLKRLEPWLFRRYLSRADETGIKALKRRIVQTATLHQDDWRNVRLGRGGLRDIEAAVQFLQLLVGGEQPAARRAGTLGAIAGLEQAEAISVEERNLLEESYIALRRVEHRLQILLGTDAADFPADHRAVERMTAAFDKLQSAADPQMELKARLDRTWHTLHKVLASAFTEEPPVPREADLLLDPAPPDEEVRAALAPFGFADPPAALATLQNLASEQVPFLSTRRCRHFLSGILPSLLGAVAETPFPDQTLSDLDRVSNSLGGKGALWELLLVHPPSLQLYVRLCAASPYLSDILTTNPGMIDELVDSLQRDRLPTRGELEATLAELRRGTNDKLDVLHDFKNAQHLRIGVRDLLGRVDIDETHQALANVAEVCLDYVAEREFEQLTEKHGFPRCGPGPAEGELSRPVIVGLGNLGGREPNYHSELDLLFLYESDGVTQPRSRRQQRTANNHFFAQLAQRIIKQLSRLTHKGRLYAVNALLRPIGVGGALAMPLADMQQHFAGGAAPLWHWQALCRARVVFGEATVARQASQTIRELLLARSWSDDVRDEVRRSRLQLEAGASERNLKRGSGGTLDVEFLVQMLQLSHAARCPDVLAPGTQDALAALGRAGALPSEVAERLGDSYRFLRRVESALRLLNTPARHDLPADEPSLRRLALLLGHSNPGRLAETCLASMAQNRQIFDAYTQ
jgi:[glutamine synthetase] adenylyltransferase / [glutamine synthetase]-adenylyl-L-tyrosine phosphorylase